MKKINSAYIIIGGFFALVIALMFVVVIINNLMSPLPVATEPREAIAGALTDRVSKSEMIREHQTWRKYNDLLGRLKSAIESDHYANLAGRTLFRRQIAQIDSVPLRVISIERTYLPVHFSGYIKKADNTTIVQMNLDNITYFVTSGDTFAGYEVADIAEDYISVKKDDSVINLEYNKSYKTENYVAVLFDEVAGKKILVRQGDFVHKIRIVSINEKQVKIEKGIKEYILAVEGDKYE